MLFVAKITTETPKKTFEDPLHQREMQDIEQDPLLAFAARLDPNTMYLHQAMQEPNKLKFIQAMQDKIIMHTANGNWEIVSRTKYQKGYKRSHQCGQ